MTYQAKPTIAAALVLIATLAFGVDPPVIERETPKFPLDTRPSAPDASFTYLIVTAESPIFTLDTRLPSSAPPAPALVVQAASAPFTLDTRLSAPTASFTNLIVTAESPIFTLDTRLPSGTPPGPGLVAQADSAPFTLDTRIASQDPLYTNSIVMAESGLFSLDTLSGWFGKPAQILAGGTTGGKVRFAPDGLRLAKTDGARVLLWNLQSTRTNFLFSGHDDLVTTLDFSPLGDQLLTGSADGTFRWWDTASRVELGGATPPGAGLVYGAYSSDGARILAGRGAAASLYRVPTMQLLQVFAGSAGSITAVAVCPEGLALAANSDRFAIVWNTATGQPVCRLTQHTTLITAAAFFPGGTNAMTASLDGTIRVWDTATGAQQLCIQAGAPVGDATLSLDGRIIAACDTANLGTASIWDAQTGSLLRVLTDTTSEASQITGLALSPDQTALATTHVDGQVRLWNTGLAPRPIYPITPLPVGASATVTLRSHGLYYFEVDAVAGRSLVVTLEADSGGGASKLKSSPASGRGLSGDAEFANLGSLPGPKVRPMGVQTPPPGADITAFRMTATKGHLPSVYDYESFAQASVTNLHCELPMATVSTSKIFVLVFSPYLAAGSITARIRAEYSDFHLSSVSPNRGGNAGTATTEILGTGFDLATMVWLTQAGLPILDASSVDLDDSTKLFVRFDLLGMRPGLYDVSIRNGQGRELVRSNAFEVLLGGQGVSSVQLFAPSAIRLGRSASFNVQVRNDGYTDIGPLLVKACIGPQGTSIANASSGGFLVDVIPRVIPMQSLEIGGTITPQNAGCYPLNIQVINTGGGEEPDCDDLDAALILLRAQIKSWNTTKEAIEARIKSWCHPDVGPVVDSNRCARLDKEWNVAVRTIASLRFACCQLCMALNARCPDPPDQCSECGLELNLVAQHLSAKNPLSSVNSSSAGFCVVRPFDPNDKIGPAGIGPNRVVSTNDFMEYMVRFENMASATAPVQELIVVDYLDAGLDWTTVEFEEIAYGDRLLTPPAGAQSFTLRDVPPAHSPSLTGSGGTNLAVNISGMFNAQAGRMEWRVTCIDTNTGTWPLDALTGILPPENGTGRGQGYVKFRVEPKANAPVGTVITNIATIIFDGNDPIATPAVWNIVGDVPSLAATIAYLPGQIMAGMPFTYTVGLTNTGTDLVENIVLTNALPPGVTVVNATATLGTVTVTNGAVIWNLGTVTSGIGGLLTVTDVASQEGTFANTLYYSGGSGLAIYTAPSEITVVASIRPPLAIRVLGGNVELAWPTNSTGFHLQRSSELGQSSTWETVAIDPEPVGNEFRLQFTPGTDAEFYRLIKP